MALAAVAAAAGVGLVLGVLAGDGSDEEPPRGSVALEGRSPRAPVGDRVRVLVALQRPSLGERVASEGELDARVQHAHVRDLERESRALRGALIAKGVRIRDDVLFSRVWSGFAATVDTEDLPQMQIEGVRVEPVRRFYPAAVGRGPSKPGSSGLDRSMAVGSQFARTPSFAVQRAQTPAGSRDEISDSTPGAAPALALLDSGVDLTHADLRGRVVPGHDAVGRDSDPGVRASRRRVDEHGTQIAGLLAHELPADEGIRVVRVAGLQRDAESGGRDEFATTDQLLAGLEYAVDPDRDGDSADRVPVALAALNSPYAGFPDTPEAEAAEAARSLGTLLVAAAGNEGEPGGHFGSIGSPAAGEAALAVAALDGDGPAVPEVGIGLAGEDGRLSADALLLAGGHDAFSGRATTLEGPSQADPEGGAPRLGDALLDYFTADARPRARGRVVVVPARVGEREPALSARAAAAAQAGASALVVADADEHALFPLARSAAGRMPVIGLGGEDAERALELAGSAGTLAFVSEPRDRAAGSGLRSAEASSRGPTYGLAVKPELAAPGTAMSATAGGGEAFVSGTSVAAARAAIAAVRLHRARPDAPPRELAAALIVSARPLGSPLATGAGALDAEAAERAPLAQPAALTFGPQPADRSWSALAGATVRNPADTELRLDLRAEPESDAVEAVPTAASVRIPAGGSATVELELRSRSAPTGFVAGRLLGEVDGESVLVLPFGVAVGAPPPARLGELRLVEEGGETRGVRFGAGAVSDRADGLAVEPLGELVLELERESGDTARTLTPPGGAVDLLPGEYGYTLTDEVLEELGPGTYRFVARARAPAGGARAERSSATFDVR